MANATPAQGIRVPAHADRDAQIAFQQISAHYHKKISRIAKLPATGNTADVVAGKLNALIDSLIAVGYMA